MMTSIHTHNVRVQKIRLISLTVTDVERSKKFYTEAFSFKLILNVGFTGLRGKYEDNHQSKLARITPTEMRQVTLQLGEEKIELMEYQGVAGKPIPTDSQSNDLWFQHLAIVVSDIDRAYDHLKSFEISPISSGVQTLPSGIRAFKFKDPDGHNLEIIWFPPEQSKDKWQQNTEELFLGIDHSAITVADTEQSLKFYQDILGMEVEESKINSGKIQAHLDGLPEAKVRVTSLRTRQGGLGIELLDYIVPGTGRPLFRSQQGGFGMELLDDIGSFGTSKPLPDNWQRYDIAHMEIQFLVEDLKAATNTLKENGVEIIPRYLVHTYFSNSPTRCPFRHACLAKDPNGHAIMLITLFDALGLKQDS